jgi:hypothetical protein
MREKGIDVKFCYYSEGLYFGDLAIESYVVALDSNHGDVTVIRGEAIPMKKK